MNLLWKNHSTKRSDSWEIKKLDSKGETGLSAERYNTSESLANCSKYSGLSPLQIINTVTRAFQRFNDSINLGSPS